MERLEEVGALVIEQATRHAYLLSQNGYWKCDCGQPLAHDYKGSAEPRMQHTAHRNQMMGEFVERIVKEYANGTI